MDFNEVMTEKINRKIKKQINNDFRFLRDTFFEFVNKYHSVEEGDYDRIMEYTLKSLSEGDEFIMFPELRESLFRKEVENMINKVLYL